MFFSRICAAVLAANVVSLVTAERVPVTGVQTGIDRNTGEVPARRNINELFGAGGPTL
jgi:tyrosinase